MKKIICLILAIVVTGYGRAQDIHEWKAALKVIDDAGQPVNRASVSIFYDATEGLTDSGRITGQTDTNGLFKISHKDKTYGLRFLIQKTGHYTFELNEDFHGVFTQEKLNRDLTIVLKKITQPTAMYVRHAQIEIPTVDKPIGFDLMRYDWIAPCGKGEHSDIVFEANRRWVSRQDFDSNLKVTFPNAGDGLIVAPAQPELLSGPRISSIAPVEGYVSDFLQKLSNTPSQGWKNDSKNQNFYFRIRTTLDENGKVKSALYGKIYGDFTLDPINSKTTWILFTYYLNPTPNSRNLEFDPNKSLFQGLPFDQQVREP